jgi:uncharacterized membrane protein (UPF0127 family)
MKVAKIYRENESLCDISIADNFWTRFKGLMGKSSEEIKKMGGLLISPCSQIHTFFMKCAIDVIYLDKEYRIIKIEEEVQPSKCCKYVKGAKCLIEFPTDSVEKYEFKVNQKLEVQ